MSACTIDLTVAKHQFQQRKKKYAKNFKFDNSRLPAGSPMYFFCRFCGIPTETLPEIYTTPPVKICTPCEILHYHGLV